MPPDTVYNLFAIAVVLCLALSEPNLIGLVFGGVDTTRDDMYLKIAEKCIAESRMADARLIVIDAETGFPIPWSDVEYVQTSHLIAYCGSLSFVHKFSRFGLTPAGTVCQKSFPC